ncbi:MULTISPECIES: hypothetical protein [unclassified Sphingobium]|uniref:hypothetical protein n=1 Tax=unclassified Sphingobium TaxID=2611147 RepID=UPI000D157A99|nr:MULTISPECIES: hypothetical protein [unclassified Sphingobium]MBG6117717.1 hypothetical protein [Sphingobium sp. JAI105]PSO09667.1 hypothetical protein C7E20_21410 [Sphingobium sp. AEW4]
MTISEDFFPACTKNFMPSLRIRPVSAEIRKASGRVEHLTLLSKDRRRGVMKQDHAHLQSMLCQEGPAASFLPIQVEI